jgi:hypothetical protein
MGGITRSGSFGNYTYTVKSGFENYPVVFTSYADGLRLANWLHNGKPTGTPGPSTTENGAYTITSTGLTDGTITRNPGASIALPNFDEFYKAAYYDPATSVYYDYPTGSNTAPISAPPQAGNAGNLAVFTGGTWRYALTGSTTFDPNFNYLTPVGAYPDAGSPSGAFDLGGNVEEWLDAPTSPRTIECDPFTLECFEYETYQAINSSNWRDDVSLSRSNNGVSTLPRYEFNNLGLRLVSFGAGIFFASGSGQASLLGGAATAGGLDIVLDVQSGEGVLSASYEEASGAEIGSLFEALTFDLPNGASSSLWDITGGEGFDGLAEITFGYDPALLPPGFDETRLAIFHLEGGSWTELLGTVDPTANTITVSTSSFSPFVLGVTAVPEPGTALLLSGGLAALAARRRARSRRGSQPTSG